MSRILLVDDDVDDCSILKEALEDGGFHVIEVKDGQEALTLLLSSELPNEIVLKLKVPRLSGVELLDVLSRYVRFARIPVALITDGDEPITPRYGGLVGSFTRPFDVERLVRALCAWLGAARSKT